MTKLLLMITVLVGCGDNIRPTIARDVACSEQADAWCSSAGFAGSVGCGIVYINWCGPQGHQMIEESAQVDCLAAIDSAKDSDAVPTECRLTWNQ